VLPIVGSFFNGGNHMDIDIGTFIKRCYEIGIKLLSKKELTKEEKEFLNVLDDFEKWIVKSKEKD